MNLVFQAIKEEGINLLVQEKLKKESLETKRVNNGKILLSDM